MILRVFAVCYKKIIMSNDTHYWGRILHDQNQKCVHCLVADKKKDTKKARNSHGVLFFIKKYYRSGMINNATMLIILINGLIAGPAVSL